MYATLWIYNCTCLIGRLSGYESNTPKTMTRVYKNSVYAPALEPAAPDPNHRFDPLPETVIWGREQRVPGQGRTQNFL